MFFATAVLGLSAMLLVGMLLEMSVIFFSRGITFLEGQWWRLGMWRQTRRLISEVQRRARISS